MINGFSLYERIGITYKDTLLFDKAQEFYAKALEIYTTLNNSKSIARITNYTGNLYREQKKFSQAYTQYTKALSIQQNINDINGLAHTENNIAELFEKQNNTEKTIHHLEQALIYAQKSHNRNLIQETSYKLYDFYKEKGNFEKSLNYFELYNTTKEKIAQDRNLQRIAELEFESDIKLLEQINENQKLKLREEHTKRQQQTILLIIVIAVAILILLFSLLLYRQFSQKRTAFNLLSDNRKKLEEAYHSLEETHILLQEKNKKITDSISYATRIQKAILPEGKTIKEAFSRHFIFYLPRDVVSGDFYWFSQQKNYTFMAAIDCTGHGIPGAFMSMIGNTLLNQIVNEQHILEPAEILNRLDKEIISTLKQYENSDQQDGLSISLIRYSQDNNEIIFSGAAQKVVCVHNETAHTYPSTQFSIGGMLSIKQEKGHTFKQTHIPIYKGMRLFLFSDGFIDQFGGSEDSRYSSKRFYKLLCDTHSLDISEQHTELSKKFDEWKQDKAQIDDVIVIGIEF
ncbi:MAG: SpoIIE family protein phosphatase [Bacteroidales bacterium]